MIEKNTYYTPIFIMFIDYILFDSDDSKLYNGGLIIYSP